MGLDARPGDDLAIDMDRTDELDVVLMQGADVGIVADEHVPFAHDMLRLAGDVADERPADRRLIGDLKAIEPMEPSGRKRPVKKSEPL